ncbi:MAG: diacylglycerol kinase family lipid kinase [Paludibacteraceae bacterium]|nr:diacylglycerol kinase family lipid kinase [Paludibacteraceae bacterium]
MKNIAFIINPISGADNQNRRRVPKLIDKLLDKEQWSANVVFTEYKGHATELAQQYAALGFASVVAVGGDGTVNEVASGLRHTQTALGVIPIGSGNGFARHLGISLRVPNAIDMLNRAEPITVDYGTANDVPFFVTCGCGFDALISEEFQKANKRGVKTYVEQIVKELWRYEPQHYRLMGDGIDLDTDAFLITFANCNQWGNAAQIAPKASIQDGKLDIAIVSKFSLIVAPALAMRLFTKNVDSSFYVNSLKARKVQLIRESAAPFHIDGDPVHMPETIDIKIVEDGLRVLAEKRF